MILVRVCGLFDEMLSSSYLYLLTVMNKLLLFIAVVGISKHHPHMASANMTCF